MIMMEWVVLISVHIDIYEAIAKRLSAPPNPDIAEIMCSGHASVRTLGDSYDVRCGGELRFADREIPLSFLMKTESKAARGRPNEVSPPANASASCKNNAGSETYLVARDRNLNGWLFQHAD